MHKALYISLFIALAFIACKKKDEPSPNNGPPVRGHGEKWYVQGSTTTAPPNSGNIWWLEFTPDSYFMIAYRDQYDRWFMKNGRYAPSGFDKYNLNGFGTVQLIETPEGVINMTLDAELSAYDTETEVTKALPLDSLGTRQLLCRSWEQTRYIYDTIEYSSTNVFVVFTEFGSFLWDYPSGLDPAGVWNVSIYNNQQICVGRDFDLSRFSEDVCSTLGGSGYEIQHWNINHLSEDSLSVTFQSYNPIDYTYSVVQAEFIAGK